jgi:bifunctional pyridoxal-dependent enzyme with beta-cystathionase and maltose regulon repressor activities
MFDFSTVVDRHGTWCTQWDYVADRFGAADLLPFTISDMDFATALHYRGITSTHQPRCIRLQPLEKR